MNSRIKLIALVLLVALLAGCAAREQESNRVGEDPASPCPYEIVEENGEYYLLFNDSAENFQTDNAFNEEAIRVEFGSMREMVQKIKNGNFTEKELERIADFKTDENGRIKMCNLSKLCEPYIPDQLPTAEVIWWRGEEYWYICDTGSGSINYFIDPVVTKQRSDSVKEYLINRENVTNYSLISVEQVEDRNATIILYSSGKTGYIKERKAVYYSITTGDKELFIFEVYTLSSDIVPSNICILGTEKGNSFICELNSVQGYFPEERPSIEWLSQFGVREYVETEVA